MTAAAVLVLGLGAPQTAAAAPPGNDTAATATVVDLLDLPYSTTAAVGDATTDADEAAIHTACGEPTTTGGVWYRVTPGYDTALTISTFADGGPGTRSVLATGTPGSLTAVDCTFISAEPTRGTTYFVLVFGVAPGEAPTEIATTISSDACYGQKLDDFDGDLCPDLAVATTRGVDVRYGNGPTRLEKRREALALPGVAALATGWLDDDRYADLVVGLPSTTVDGRARAGEVRVYFGSRTGLGGGRATAVLHQGTLPGTGGAEAGDLFGAALAVGQDGDVAIGAPGETVGDVVGAGGVVRVSFRTTVRGSFASQAGPVPGTPETGDAFGSAVAWGVGQARGRRAGRGRREPPRRRRRRRAADLGHAVPADPEHVRRARHRRDGRPVRCRAATARPRRRSADGGRRPRRDDRPGEADRHGQPAAPARRGQAVQRRRPADHAGRGAGRRRRRVGRPARPGAGVEPTGSSSGCC
nr:hypothetical protein [Angustibacter aerolatus]